jgi:hypothetical protein
MPRATRLRLMVWQITFEPPVRYPDIEFLDGDFRQISTAEPLPDWPLAFQAGSDAFVFGRPISPHNVAKKATWYPQESVYDFATLYGAALMSDRTRDLIEALEPDVHQYFPLELVDSQGHFHNLAPFITYQLVGDDLFVGNVFDGFFRAFGVAANDNFALCGAA